MEGDKTYRLRAIILIKTMKRQILILGLTVLVGMVSLGMIYRPGDYLFIDTWQFYHDGTIRIVLGQ